MSGQVSIQSGAAVAALLFSRLGTLGVLSLRLVIAAVVLMLLCRPRLRTLCFADLKVAVGFGFTLAAMNLFLYEAIARIPLGAAVTIEVLGPLVLSVLTSRRAISWLWALLALIGVLLLGRSSATHLDVLGTLFAVAAAAMWAAYILFSKSVGQRFRGLDGLAIAMAVAAVITVPVGAGINGPQLIHPTSLALGAAVAVLSSLLPYSFDLLALHRLPATTFAVLMSLAPATATIAGLVILGQSLNLITAIAIGLVVVAGAGAVRSSAAPEPGTTTGGLLAAPAPGTASGDE